MLCVFSIVMYAQQNITQFLGIPVDGSKAEMIQKLKTKGYKNDSIGDVLTGEFNGVPVNIFIVTNKDKVCRIMICDANYVDERTIQIRFNKLCEQFSNNPKYLAFENYVIPENEDISYEIAVHNKRYEAVFYQNFAIDTIAYAEKIATIIQLKYTEEQLKNQTEEIKSDIMAITAKYILEDSFKRPVWFMISDYYGKYYITMFYDNEYNRANGEDL